MAVTAQHGAVLQLLCDNAERCPSLNNSPNYYLASEQEMKILSRLTWYNNILHQYCMIIENCIKMIFSIEKYCIKSGKNKNPRFCDVNIMKLINGENVQISMNYIKNQPHNLCQYFEKETHLTKVTQNRVESIYNKSVNECKLLPICYDLSFANFQRSLHINQRHIVHFRYSMEPPTDWVPCGVIMNQHLNLVPMPEHCNFAHCLLNFCSDYSSWIQELKETYS